MYLGMEKKRGFCSSDWPRRDEFSHPIRMQQYRETLKVCVCASCAWHTVAQAEARRMAARAPATTGATVQEPATPRSALVELYNKLHDDKANKTVATPLTRRTGPLRSAYAQHFDANAGVAYKRPAHARKPLIRDTFGRRNDVALHLDPALAERRWLTFFPPPSC